MESDHLGESNPPKKVVVESNVKLLEMSKEELIEWFNQQSTYVNHLEQEKPKCDTDNSTSTAATALGGADTTLAPPAAPMGASEEKLRQQQLEATRRENVLVMRLATKEQELQDYVTQLEELKQTTTSNYRSALLDPAVNILFQKMQDELRLCKEKLETSQQEMNAWKFTPDSQYGKRLMTKCRVLYRENEEFGQKLNAGEVAKMSQDISLRQKLIDQLKEDSDSQLDLLYELDESNDALQTTIIDLQKKLQVLKLENEQLKHQLSERRTHVANDEPATMESEVMTSDHATSPNHLTRPSSRSSATAPPTISSETESTMKVPKTESMDTHLNTTPITTTKAIPNQLRVTSEMNGKTNSKHVHNPDLTTSVQDSSSGALKGSRARQSRSRSPAVRGGASNLSQSSSSHPPRSPSAKRVKTEREDRTKQQQPQSKSDDHKRNSETKMTSSSSNRPSGGRGSERKQQQQQPSMNGRTTNCKVRNSKNVAGSSSSRGPGRPRKTPRSQAAVGRDAPTERTPSRGRASRDARTASLERAETGITLANGIPAGVEESASEDDYEFPGPPGELGERSATSRTAASTSSRTRGSS